MITDAELFLINELWGKEEVRSLSDAFVQYWIDGEDGFTIHPEYDGRSMYHDTFAMYLMYDGI